MRKNIFVLSGAASSGKSTLTKVVSDKLDLRVRCESIRKWCKHSLEEIIKNKDLAFSVQITTLQQLYQIYSDSEKSEVFLYDRSPFDSIIYYELNVGKPLKIYKDILKFIGKYCVTFIVKPYDKIVDDGFRLVNYERRTKEIELFYQYALELEEFGEVYYLSGDLRMDSETIARTIRSYK